MAEKKKAKPKGKAQARVRPPALEFDDLTQRGEKALLLIERHPKVVERLEAGAGAALRADLDSVSEKRAAPAEVSAVAKAATATQNQKAEQLKAQATAIRAGVGKSDAKADVKKAYGAGMTIVAGKITSVVALANTIVKRAEKKPDEAKALGILPTDVTNLKTLIVEVTQADKDQEKVIAAKPLSTRERNEAGRRIWAAVKDIAAKGVMAYALEQQIRAEFDVLDDLPKAKAKGTPA